MGMAHAAPLFPAPGSRSGLSLIEVMIAMALLAVALSAAVSALASSVQSNAYAEDREKANDLMRRVSDRLLTTRWDDLMVGWTASRYAQEANGLHNDNGLEEADLITAGVLDRPSGLADALVNIEYYRATAARPPLPTSDSSNGLLERWDGTLQGYVPVEAATAGQRFDDPAVLAACRISGTASSLSEPILIRVLIRWNLEATATTPVRRDGRLSACLIRRRESDPNPLDLSELPGLP